MESDTLGRKMVGSQNAYIITVSGVDNRPDEWYRGVSNYIEEISDG